MEVLPITNCQCGLAASTFAKATAAKKNAKDAKKRNRDEENDDGTWMRGDDCGDGVWSNNEYRHENKGGSYDERNE